MSRKLPNASEMGQVGGRKIAEDRGAEYMREIGKKGNETMKQMGEDFYKERARKIAESRKRNKKKKNSTINQVVTLLNGK